MDKFLCEKLNQLTGYCSFINKNINKDNEVACNSCQCRSGCTHCLLKADVKCIIGEKCEWDDSI